MSFIKHVSCFGNRLTCISNQFPGQTRSALALPMKAPFVKPFFRIAALLGVTCLATESAEVAPTLDHPNIKSISVFAEHPDIVTPVGIAVAPDGRVFVQENNTHQRQRDYPGPETDRILIFEDTDGDGVSDTRSVFYEGDLFSTDLLFGPDGHLYVATRWFVGRFPNASELAKAEADPEILINCETGGEYPHNGVGGLAIDPANPDWLAFGFGENLGADYTFVGSDGTRLSGGGEGGSTYRCRTDGSQLERLSTGHWNPFGMAFDLKGNLFCTDNDPSSTPPNRLLHIVAGGDFGYEFRYGRSGHHPLVTWTGENPGSLGMVTGIGEAACGIIPFGPGEMLVASWGDNRVYLHTLVPKGRSFSATREHFISGSNLFRPVHFAYNQDASALYISDWVKSAYPVHGQGRIWRVEMKQPVELTPKPRESFSEMSYQTALEELGSSDPYARNEAIRIVARDPKGHWQTIEDPVARSHYAVALRRSNFPDIAEHIPELLNDPSESVRYVAIKWIADDKLVNYRAQLMKQLDRPDISRKLLLAVLAAQQRLDGIKISDKPTPAQLLPIINDSSKPSRLRALALSLLSKDDLPLEKLIALTKDESSAISLEAVRSLAGSDTPDALEVFAAIAKDPGRSSLVRAEAIVGLAINPKVEQMLLQRLSSDQDPIVAEEAQRALVGGGLQTRNLEPKPQATDVSQWESLLNQVSGSPNPDTGRRIFFHPRLAICASCHQMDGRGVKVGPELTTIHRQAGIDVSWLLTHTLNPSETIAPHYQPWQIFTKNGDVKMGFVLRKGGNAETYLGIDGQEFRVEKSQILRTQELTITLMPPGLLDPLKPTEIRDLLAYLLSSNK